MIRLHSIESLGALDGPGLRTVIFLSGCPLRCAYCHNPDTWSLSSGQVYTVDDLHSRIKRYKAYYGKEGGVTLSGGEPLLQARALIPLVHKLKKDHIHVALDTSGAVWNADVAELLSIIDLVILDLKHTDAKKYKDLTQGQLKTAYAFLEHLKTYKIPYWIRQVIVPNVNDSHEQVLALNKLTQSSYRRHIELLPFHQSGRHKWQKLKLDYSFKDVEPMTLEALQPLQALLKPE